MSVGVFTDKAHAPTSEQILIYRLPASGLGRNAPDHLGVLFSPGRLALLRQELWVGFAVSQKRKALVSLYPAEGSFTVQLILSQVDVDKAHGLKLGKHIRRIIEQAHPFPEER